MFGIFKKKTPENGGGLSATAQLVADGDTAVRRFSGVWLLSKKRTPVDEIVQMITPDIKRLSFDTGALKAYDSALVGMLFRCYEACAQLGIEFDSHSLPKGPRELLKLAVAVPEADASPKGGVRFNIINRVDCGYKGCVRKGAVQGLRPARHNAGGGSRSSADCRAD